MEFSDRNPEDPPMDIGGVPSADAFSFSGDLFPVGEADDSDEPAIFAHPNAGDDIRPRIEEPPRDAVGATETAQDNELLAPATETVFDMGDDEQAAFMTTMERFAAGGERFSYGVTPAGPDDDPAIPCEGYTRSLPPEALAAEGLSYDEVCVSVFEATTEDPYMVSIIAKREKDFRVELTSGPDGGPVSETVKGRESKVAGFSVNSLAPGVAPMALLDARSDLVARYPGISEPLFDNSAPLLSLHEVRAMVRIMEHAVASDTN